MLNSALGRRINGIPAGSLEYEYIRKFKPNLKLFHVRNQGKKISSVDEKPRDPVPLTCLN
jgi:hypothetical protein